MERHPTGAHRTRRLASTFIGSLAIVALAAAPTMAHPRSGATFSPHHNILAAELDGADGTEAAQLQAIIEIEDAQDNGQLGQAPDATADPAASQGDQSGSGDGLSGGDQSGSGEQSTSGDGGTPDASESPDGGTDGATDGTGDGGTPDATESPAGGTDGSTDGSGSDGSSSAAPTDSPDGGG